MTVQSTNSTAAPAALSYGEVQTPVADLRAEPRDDAERVNQALLATPLEVLDTHTDAAGDPWLRVGRSVGEAGQEPVAPCYGRFDVLAGGLHAC